MNGDPVTMDTGKLLKQLETVYSAPFGEADLVIAALYDADAQFEDPIMKVSGIDDVRSQFLSLRTLFSKVEFIGEPTLLTPTQDALPSPPSVLFKAKVRYTFRLIPLSLTIVQTTHVVMDESATKITSHVDEWSLASLFSGITILGRIYDAYWRPSIGRLTSWLIRQSIGFYVTTMVPPRFDPLALALYFGDPSHTRLASTVRNGVFFCRRRARHANEAIQAGPEGRKMVAIVTGGTSGIGLKVAEGLARRGLEVHITCRDLQTGENVAEALQTQVNDELAAHGGGLRCRVVVHRVDMSRPGEVLAFARGFTSVDGERKLDILVNNVAVLPSRRQVTADGLDEAFAANVAGFFILTSELTPLLAMPGGGAQSEGRVVNVVSAGMEAIGLDVDSLEGPSTGWAYDGRKQYALHHRARVCLTEYWAATWKENDLPIRVNCCHPGWVDTPGLRDAVPLRPFYRTTKMLGLLRDEAMGADTPLWLALSDDIRVNNISGKYFFDRRPRKTTLGQIALPSPDQRTALVQLCTNQHKHFQGLLPQPPHHHQQQQQQLQHTRQTVQLHTGSKTTPAAAAAAGGLGVSGGEAAIATNATNGSNTTTDGQPAVAANGVDEGEGNAGAQEI
ncbi:unnamed protein product [Vitrella brassicaformis CCMP3155]|uniref:SnoaL-like domain-containing protein n=1 Tax=Vitrella brassicaformis (strain CCMP3155) TaxID=1169540 RepID=A0A0G4GVT3_VITBC|nr:unnamed protein product [Vitrella brassicaformis CCMP3155]|eukprot:CEM35036.1 unnamed protein product [Vitrella brassicaformis CCMP3155]